MNRRSFLTRVVPAAAAVSFLGIDGARGAARERAELMVTDVADHLFVISGGGGNVTVFNSSEGVLLVDGGSPERSADVLKLVKKRTGTSKVHTLFNTHWHWDQTGSNAALGKAGARIISHENTRLWLTTDVESKWEHRTYPALPRVAQPNKTFYTSEKLSFGGETIEYAYLPQAHTDGDIYVFFKNAKGLGAGEVVAVAAYPVSEYGKNGWIGGMVNATKTLVDLCNESTRVIPGSGSVQSRADVAAENEMLTAMKLKLSKLLAAGMSAQDMIDAAPTREFDAKWGDPKLFIANAWPGLVWRARELGVSIV
jgi:glyoxylase-like metal-dependent hydrolase (beta-lactamase superfamily II)